MMMQRIIRLVDHLRLFGAGLVSDPTDIVFCLALALLPAGGTCGADSCRDSCLAVNAWELGVLGVLLPLAVLWGLEERSRLLFQRQWLELHSPPSGSGTSSIRCGSTGNSTP